jgi:prepilin-type processing-associated H-X9-DG protein
VDPVAVAFSVTVCFCVTVFQPGRNGVPNQLAVTDCFDHFDSGSHANADGLEGNVAFADGHADANAHCDRVSDCISLPLKDEHTHAFSRGFVD